jgi:hypothetical protein
LSCASAAEPLATAADSSRGKRIRRGFIQVTL